MSVTTTKGQGMITQAQGGGTRRLLMRVFVVLLAALVLLPGLQIAGAQDAVAIVHTQNDDRKNYSLYQLGSNAATYFGEMNSPEAEGLHNKWDGVVGSPGSAGSMLGYADPEFSVGNVMGWLFAEVSGSSQTVSYASLHDHPGMLQYAHFGSANRMLGFDSMGSPSGAMGAMLNSITGGIIWVLYFLAMIVPLVFWLALNFLQLINPFKWFYLAVGGNPSGDAVHNLEMADGMTGGDGGGGALSGLQVWIGQWYGLLTDLAWNFLVPVFMGVLLFSLVMFKNMNRGSAIKKFVVRLIFIGVGLPLVGSMYTAVLDKFSDEALGAQAGPTRVVLSTYVDFESWMINERLAVPSSAHIGWKDGTVSDQSVMQARNTALAINVSSNGNWSGMQAVPSGSDAVSQWSDSMDTGVSPGGGVQDDLNGGGPTGPGGNPGVGFGSNLGSVAATFDLLRRHIWGETVSASSFESNIKTKMQQWADDDVKKLFVDDGGKYGSPKEFGEDAEVDPVNHPVISVRDGLNRSGEKFVSNNVVPRCGTQAGAGWQTPMRCNMSPLAAYNYLNTSFGETSLETFSSNLSMSSFSREHHMSTSQVGTGPSKVMYWMNSVVLLACISLLGIWYALGMLIGAVKRMFGLVAAVPFATLGAIPAIAKVVVYSMAMIVEIIATVFMYQFVVELLVSLPTIISGPVTTLFGPGGAFGGSSMLSGMAGTILILFMTMASSLLIIGVTVALMRARKVVVQAIDEAVTKFVDKFLDTNVGGSANAPGMKTPGGRMADTMGAAAGLAAGSKLGGAAVDGMKNKLGGGSGGSGLKSAATNTGGTNDPSRKALEGSGGLAQLEAGRPGDDEGSNAGGLGGDGPDNPSGDGPGRDGSDGTGGVGEGGTGGTGVKGEDGGSGADGDDRALPPGQSVGDRDRVMAQRLQAQGGLSRDYGYDTDGPASQAVVPGEVVKDGGGSTVDRPGGKGQVTSGTKGQIKDGTTPQTRAGSPTTATRPGEKPGSTSLHKGSEKTDSTGFGSTSEQRGKTSFSERVGQGTDAAPDGTAAVVAGSPRRPGAGQGPRGSATGSGSESVGMGSAAGTGLQQPGLTETTETRTTRKVVPTTGGADSASGGETVGTGMPTGGQDASPRPLSEVPLSDKSAGVTRQPGESDISYNKQRAHAEGWRQTPQGWVPPQEQVAPAGGPSVVAGTAPAGRSGAKVDGRSGGSTPDQTSVGTGPSAQGQGVPAGQPQPATRPSGRGATQPVDSGVSVSASAQQSGLSAQGQTASTVPASPASTGRGQVPPSQSVPASTSSVASDAPGTPTVAAAPVIQPRGSSGDRVAAQDGRSVGQAPQTQGQSPVPTSTAGQVPAGAPGRDRAASAAAPVDVSQGQQPVQQRGSTSPQGVPARDVPAGAPRQPQVQPVTPVRQGEASGTTPSSPPVQSTVTPGRPDQSAVSTPAPVVAPGTPAPARTGQAPAQQVAPAPAPQSGSRDAVPSQSTPAQSTPAPAAPVTPVRQAPAQPQAQAPAQPQAQASARPSVSAQPVNPGRGASSSGPLPQQQPGPVSPARESQQPGRSSGATTPSRQASGQSSLPRQSVSQSRPVPRADAPKVDPAQAAPAAPQQAQTRAQARAQRTDQGAKPVRQRRVRKIEEVEIVEEQRPKGRGKRRGIFRRR